MLELMIQPQSESQLNLESLSQAESLSCFTLEILKACLSPDVSWMSWPAVLWKGWTAPTQGGLGLQSVLDNVYIWLCTVYYPKRCRIKVEQLQQRPPGLQSPKNVCWALTLAYKP